MRHPVRRLVVVGSVVGEFRLSIPNRPEPGGSVRAEHNVVQAGGCYRAIGTARTLGLPAVLVGRFGDNPVGRLLRVSLSRIDVETPVRAVPGEHGYTVLAVENNADVTRIEVAGVESTLTRSEIERVALTPEDAVLIFGTDLVSHQAGTAIAGWVADGGLGEATLVFAPGPLAPDIPDTVFDAVIGRTDILTLNGSEFALITGVSLPQDRQAAATELLGSLGPAAMMLVRVDGQGCWLVRRDAGASWFDAPAPNGSGATTECRLSAHLGIFLAELARLDDPVEATRIATLGWTRVPGPDIPWVTALGPGRAELDALAAGYPAAPA